MATPSVPVGLTPHLALPNAAAAIAFYTAAFGARELARHTIPGSDRIMHARLDILGSLLFLNDDFPEFANGQSRTPAAFGGCPIVLSLQVDDADAAWNEAVAAGAEVVMPLADMFWGDRYGQLRDPFGYTWSISQTIAAPTPEEVDVGASKVFKRATAGV